MRLLQQIQQQQHPHRQQSDSNDGGQTHSVWCQQQVTFEHGSQMCTTACMQVGMAVLCGQLDLQRAWQASQRSDGPALQDATATLDWCMNAGSVVHGRVSALMERREHAKRRQQASGISHHFDRYAASRSRMISANELVSVLGIDLQKLGVAMEELVVCRQGLKTKLAARKACGNNHSGKGLQYEAESCYISLSHLPLCLSPPLLGEKQQQQHQQGGGAAAAAVALITANHHTICAACYVEPRSSSSGSSSSSGARHGYAVFDPMPGELVVGLSATGVVDKVQRLLRFPRSVRGAGVEKVEIVAGVAGESIQDQDAKNKKRGRCESGSGAEQEEVVAAAVDDAELCFYGDVTIMYVV